MISLKFRDFLSVLCLFFFALLYSIDCHAEEKITSYNSFIDIDTAGTLIVTETISVVSEGKNIRRGIYRDFPTSYRDRFGNKVKVGFTIVDIKRDGRPEPYHIESQSNGKRVYLGKKDIFIPRGPHTYEITYKTDRQIGFFKGYDEIYWNVTGNDWIFPIEQASATVALPSGATILQSASYTGYQGSKSTNAEVVDHDGGLITFQTKKALAPKQGLTIAVAWPKGIVSEPTATENVGWFVQDNLNVLIGTIGLIILFTYYFLVWLKVGKDPVEGTVIPSFEPPKGFSPAAARFVMRMGFDDKTFAAAIVSMAVKKYLRIEEEKKGFSIVRGGGGDYGAHGVLSAGERKTAAKMFSRSDRLNLKKDNHITIRSAIATLEKSLRTDFEKLHFKLNRMYLLPGLVITLIILAAIVLTAGDKAAAAFMSVWLSGWTVGCFFLVLNAYQSWKIVRAPGAGLSEAGGAISSTLFALPFIGGWFVGFGMFTVATSFATVIALATVLSLNLLFFNLLKAPTLLGRKVMDQLEGFKLYLSVAEKDRLNLLNPPGKTPELFERFLPWALALEVEQAWSEQFADILDKASREENYAPSWYYGQRSFSTSNFTSSLSTSLTSTISSSSTAPGSSSGSGGGGSSGGGGGGGGGGGW